MDLHHHPVFNAHGGEFGEHLSTEQLRVIRGPDAGHNSTEQRLLFAVSKIRRPRRRMTMIGRGGSRHAKIGPALPVSAQIPVPTAHVFAAELAEALEGYAEVVMFRIDNGVGAVGRDDPALPAGLTNRSVVLE